MTIKISGVVVLCFKLNHMLEKLFLYSLTFALFLFGISNDVRNISHLTLITSVILGFIILFRSNLNLKIPKHIEWITLFAAILQIYLFFIKPVLNPFYFSVLFIEGVSLLFIIYNLDIRIVNNLYKVLFVLGVLYFIFYFLSTTLNISLTKLSSLFFMDNNGKGHLQLGSLWMAVIVFLIGNKVSKNNFYIKNIVRYEIILYLIGIYLTFISRSRSAYLALLITVLFLLKDKIFSKKYIYSIAIISMSVILYVSLNRSLLFSRPYFLQSLIGFMQYPFGVGMGNFRIISESFYNNDGFLNSFSDSAHNIILETISGVGILATPFIIWFILLVRELLKNEKLDLAWFCVFITLTCLFLIDISYSIPSLFILWFVSIGVLQRNLKT